MKILLVLLFLGVMTFPSSGQASFPYSLYLEEVEIVDLPGLHNYAFAQSDGKWLIIGGRKDGLHARQPFASFPGSENNTDMYVVDVAGKKFWSASVNSLPVGIREQLQSTNMNFFQDHDTLYIIGGYAYSSSEADHKTFPALTSVKVSSVISAIINGNPVKGFFKQITDTTFAVTGGQLGKIGDYYFLAGGQRFDGRYNPMNHNTFTQRYTNQIRKFKLNNKGSQLSFSNYSAVTDAVHLRRRDYNLVPQIFPDGKEGYTISSGVFQLTANLPFLYPVDITAGGYKAVTSFNQYLSNYHSATSALYDSAGNEIHTLFFGGMSQFYYKNGVLTEDKLVPFVKTISRVTRYSDGSLREFKLPIEMPGLKGAGAEFFPNHSLPHYPSEIIKLNRLTNDTVLIGYIYGGIESPSLNPFDNNATGTTSADNSIYAVKLVKNSSVGTGIDGANPYKIIIYPNPVDDVINLRFNVRKAVKVDYIISTSDGRVLQKGMLNGISPGLNNLSIKLDKVLPAQVLLTVIFEGKYYVTRKLLAGG